MKYRKKPSVVFLDVYFFMCIGLCLLSISPCGGKIIEVYNVISSQTLSPVIFVPGDGGCQLEAKWNKTTTVEYICTHIQNSWTTLWLAVSELAPYAVYCFVDNTRLVYNRENHTTSDSPGVEIRVPGFGNTSTVEYLDPDLHREFSQYFNYIADYVVRMGYQKGSSERGGPFDFRKAPNELHPYFGQLRHLIEETYGMNNNLKVTLIAHSMGAPILHAFFNGQTQAWKDQYIESIITLSGAWGGSVKPVKVYAIGDDLGSRFVSASALRNLQISFPSLAFMLPSRELWNSTEPIIVTPEKNYTINDLEPYFQALNFTDGYEMYKDTRDILFNAPAPGVEIHCLHGVDVPTTNRVYYAKQTDFPWNPTLLKGDGDGTVNLRSLERCLKWAREQKQKIFYKTFPKVDHMQILSDPGVLQYIGEYLKSVAASNAAKLKKQQGPPPPPPKGLPKYQQESNYVQQFLEKFTTTSYEGEKQNIVRNKDDRIIKKMSLVPASREKSRIVNSTVNLGSGHNFKVILTRGRS